MLGGGVNLHRDLHLVADGEPGFAAGIGIAAILLNYYSVSLSEYVSSTAYGSFVALYVITVILCFVVRHLTRSDNLAFGLGFIAP